jgi:hypothetical protein
MHLLPGVAIQPNLELKTRPKQLLGSVLLVIALPGGSHMCTAGRGEIEIFALSALFNLKVRRKCSKLIWLNNEFVIMRLIQKATMKCQSLAVS